MSAKQNPPGPVEAVVRHVARSQEELRFVDTSEAPQQDERQLRLAIQRANREWELTFDAVPDAILVIDEDHNVARANRAATEVLERSFADLIGRPCHEVVHGRDTPLPSCPHQRLLATGQPECGDVEETRLGRTFHSRTTPLRDPQGVVRGCVHVLHDVTEQKMAEAALCQAEEKYRSIFENAVEGIFQTSTDGAFLAANPAMARILGYASLGDLLRARTGIAAQSYVHPEKREEFQRLMRQHEAVSGFEFELYRKDGSRSWVSESVRRVCDATGHVLYYEGTLADITERKQLEEQLRHAQKMESVGQLAGGVAHDFNNLLGVMLGYCDLLLENSSVNEHSRNQVSEIRKAVRRAAEITRQLLAFSRKQVLQTRKLDLNDLIRETSGMLERLLGEDIELITMLGEKLELVLADPTQVEQIIMNLAVNARDAMSNGGRLTIETSNVRLDPTNSIIRHLDVPAGDYVMLAVSDTGAGMDGETQKHIFEPFYTTKGKGKGTGLGLSTVYGVVKQSDGFIWVHSEVQHGSTFKIYLPRVRGSLVRPPAAPRAAVELGTETILLVEDDAALLQLNHDLLADMGYHVLPAANGAEAISLAEDQSTTIHLLMTDVVMPGLSGHQLADQLTQSRLALKVLYVSGYADSVIQRAVLDAGAAFLQKPFDRDVLAKTLRTLLHPEFLAAKAG
jgi:two-component system cell cycle sensor histidine kinase/response regulator CckA